MALKAIKPATYTLVQRPRNGGILFSDLAYLKLTGRKKTVLMTLTTTKAGNESVNVSFKKGVNWSMLSMQDQSVTQLRVATIEINAGLLFPRDVPADLRAIAIREYAAYLIAQAESLSLGSIEPGVTLDVPNGTQDA